MKKVWENIARRAQAGVHEYLAGIVLEKRPDWEERDAVKISFTHRRSWVSTGKGTVCLPLDRKFGRQGSLSGRVEKKKLSFHDAGRPCPSYKKGGGKKSLSGKKGKEKKSSDDQKSP